MHVDHILFAADLRRLESVMRSGQPVKVTGSALAWRVEAVDMPPGKTTACVRCVTTDKTREIDAAQIEFRN